MTETSSFLLLDRLAIGGMAEVYRAKTLGVMGFEKIIAIKRMRPQLAEDEEFVQMFVEEAKIAGRLRHANITRIFELGKIDDSHFIAMEYVFGRDLLQLWKDLRQEGRRMPPAMAAFIVASVLSGLDYAHRQRDTQGQHLRLIHRDVSPPNILISYDGVVKLCDFGIAKAASRATQTLAGVIKGKLGYMSPEQVSGLELDHRSDVFAASTVLWELLTGQRLWGKGPDLEVIQRLRATEAVAPSSLAPNVPPVLDEIVLRGLAHHPDDRWETAGDMHEALMSVAVTSHPPFSTSRLAEWMQTEYALLIEDQRAHLERLSHIEEAGVNVTSGQNAVPEDLWDDPTVMSAPPAGGDMPSEEVSTVIRIDHVIGLSSPDEPDDTSPLPPMPRGTHAGHSEPIAVSSASRSLSSPDLPAVDGLPRSLRGAGRSIEVELGDLEPTMPPRPAPALVRPPQSLELEVEVTPATRELDSIRIEAPSPRVLPPAAPRRRLRWGTVVTVALLAVLLGAGGVALWLHLNGYPLPFVVR